MNKEINQKIEAFLLWAANLFFAIPNALFIIRGYFSRLWADDYCFSGIFVEFGFLKGLVQLYNNVSNRFSAYLFSSFTDWVSWQSIKFFIPLAILALLVGFVFFFRKIFRNHLKRNDWIITLLIAQIALFFILLQSPNINQGVYWRSGMSHYFLPLIPFVFLVKLSLFPENMKKWNLIPVFLLAFFSAGLSESYASLQAATAGVILLKNMVMPGKKNKPSNFIIIVILIASFIAVGIMAAAPGNQRRLEVVERVPDLQSFLFLSFRYAADFIWYSLRGFWLPNLVLFGLSFILSLQFFRNNKREKSLRWKLTEISALLISGYLLVVSITAPTVFIMSAYPENRVLMMARFVMILTIILLGISAGNLLGYFRIENHLNKYALLVLLLLFSLYPLRSVLSNYAGLAQAQTRAQDWDERRQEIMMQKAEGVDHITVTALDAFSEIAELSGDPSFWVNQCAARYYGVESIAAFEGLHE